MIARRGTTVLELVVALIVTAATAAAGAAAFGQMMDRREQILDAAVHTERVSAMRATLREWIGAGQVEPPATTRQVLALGTQHVAALTDNELVFTTYALTPARVPGIRLRLYVDADPATPERGLTIEYRPRPSAAFVRRELDPAIGRMVVEYLDGPTGRWIAAADATLISPIAVRLLFPPMTTDEARLRALPLTFALGTPEARTAPGVREERAP